VVRQSVHTDSPADVVALLRRLSPAFPDTLAELMKWRDCTIEELAEKALTSRSTVGRLLNDADYESSKPSRFSCPSSPRFPGFRPAPSAFAHAVSCITAFVLWRSTRADICARLPSASRGS